jgi:hypothetical protein
LGKAEALIKTVKQSDIEELWKTFEEKTFTIFDAVKVLFPGKQNTDMELYTALRLMRENFIYFRPRTQQEFMCRPKEHGIILI